jgi:hypothetical protein
VALESNSLFGMKRSVSSTSHVDEQAAVLFELTEAAYLPTRDQLPAYRAVTLADVDSGEHDLSPGDLVLGVAVPDGAAAELLRAAALADVAAVVLRRPPRTAAVRLIRYAESAQLILLWLRPGAGWGAVHRQLVGVLPPPITDATIADSELADLAQRIAALTGGLVTIEDTADRVLAYSRSSDDVDDLRRLSILGRSGPPHYLALLRQWGIYERLAASEEIIEIGEHPESGIRRRLAIGVSAGGRQMGTIWVQQGATDFPPQARQALLGAARLTATLLAGRRTSAVPARASGLAELLAGHPRSAVQLLGRAATRPCIVAVFDPGPGSGAPATDDLRLDELTGIISIHAAAVRADTLVTPAGRRIYALLPAMDSPKAASAGLSAALNAGLRHAGPDIRVAIGDVAPTVAQAAASSRSAELVLDTLDFGGIACFTAVRGKLVVAAALAGLGQQPELHDPALQSLHDTHPDLTDTLLRYLDGGGSISQVAAQLAIHATTARHRLHRARQLTGLNLQDADARLAAHLQLRLLARRASDEPV